jgi:hypothetical protein
MLIHVYKLYFIFVKRWFLEYNYSYVSWNKYTYTIIK